MQRVLTSLVVTTYNRAAMLADALKSVAASRVDNHRDVEVIVVDNNSTDGTQQTVEEVRAKKFPFVLHYAFEPRQGVSYARNRGTEESAGKYIAFMDDDQLIDRDYLSRLESAFRSTRAACVGGPIFYYNKSSLPNWLSPLLEGVGQCDYGDEIKILGPGDGNLHMGNMAFERRELIDIGKFDVSLGRCGDSLLAGEEDELQERLHLAAKPVAYHPGLVQYHYLAPERLTKHFWRKYRFDYGRTLYLRSIRSGFRAVSGASFLGAPPWLWRFLLTRDIPQVAWSLTSLDAPRIFHKELDVWTRLGQIYEARHDTGRRKA